MKYFALFSLSTILIISGCTSSSDDTPYTEGRAEKYAPPQVQMTGLDAAALRKATYVDVPVMWRETGLLFITVPVRNTSAQVLHVQYQYNFVDDQGRPMPENIAWHNKVLEPGATERITFNSVSPKAADFQMNLRFGR